MCSRLGEQNDLHLYNYDSQVQQKTSDSQCVVYVMLLQHVKDPIRELEQYSNDSIQAVVMVLSMMQCNIQIVILGSVLVETPSSTVYRKLGQNVIIYEKNTLSSQLQMRVILEHLQT